MTTKPLRVQNKKISQPGKLLLYSYSYVPWDIQQCWQASCLKDQQSALNITSAFWTTSILIYAKQNHRHIRDVPLPGHISSQTLQAAHPLPAHALQTHPACILRLLSSKQRSLEKVLSEWRQWNYSLTPWKFILWRCNGTIWILFHAWNISNHMKNEVYRYCHTYSCTVIVFSHNK